MMRSYFKKAEIPGKYFPKWFLHSFASQLPEDHMRVNAGLRHSNMTVAEGSDLLRQLNVIPRQKIIDFDLNNFLFAQCIVGHNNN